MFLSLRKPLSIVGLIVLLLLLGAITAGAIPSLRTSAQASDPPADSSPTLITSSVNNTFTYQGRLDHNGTPVSATCDFRFSLWDAAQGGNQIDANDQQQLPVSDGTFTAVLNENGDLGDAPFDGPARWLEIHVRCPAGSGNYVILTPRQPLTAAPYALGLRPGATISGVDGMLVTEGAPTVGTALSVPDAGGLVWVLVNLH